ncbi:MAG: Ig-like domain-containing protein [Prevotella sp.]
MAHSSITNGYAFTYTPSSALSDGSHTVTINVSDNDGNAATQASRTYAIDTIAPTLNVTNPSNNFLTNTAALTVQGSTNDATSSPVTVTITLNGTGQGTVAVSGGTFTKAITLAEGPNTVVVTATDAAGKTTSVTRAGTLDTSIPTISSVTVSPNPAGTGNSMLISVVVSG